MDIERKIELICRPPAEEIVTTEDLRQLLESEEHPIAYNGWEPSGLAHLGTGVICAYKMKDFAEAGIHFKAFLATWHAYLNNKLGGDLVLIKKAADLFRHSWLALGVPEDKVEFIYSDILYDDLDYWAKTMAIAKNLTIARTTRTLEIAGRKDTDARYVSDFLYTPMQVADIFHMKVKICQLGMDQRKANMVGREIGEKMGYWKPVCVHHHLLQGLEKPTVWPIPEGQEKEAIASAKMSKSKPDTSIFMTDTKEDIKRKINKAYCPEKIVLENPILEYNKFIVFEKFDKIKIERPTKFGGDVEYNSYIEMEKDFINAKLHPMDLKNATTEYLNKLVEPTRKHFETNKKAKELLEKVKSFQTTR